MDTFKQPEFQFEQPESPEQSKRMPPEKDKDLFARMHQVADDAAKGLDIKAAEGGLAPSFSVDGVEIISDGAREDEDVSDAGFNDGSRSKRRAGQAGGWLAEHEERQDSVGERLGPGHKN